MKNQMKTKFALMALGLFTSIPLLAFEMTDGEVRKIDLEQGKVTLRHAEIKDLDMPSMTMVFVVKDCS